MLNILKTLLKPKYIVAGVSGLALLALFGVFNQPEKAFNSENNNPNAVLSAEAETSNEVQKQEPIVTTSTETKTESVPYGYSTKYSDSINSGESRITTYGIDGTRTLTYVVTYTDGIETDRKLLSSAVTVEPINQVTTFGTYVAPQSTYSTYTTNTSSNCDPNYSGCVPIASDVDCAGGSGNGPAYTYGPVTVIGYDIYGLDRDGDGIGCE